MDRRSWLWRRKSSEKSPTGETESSGSASSHSERFSDDQALSNHNTQSPEVTSKATAGSELNGSVETLSEKLSEALLNIHAKEDLVKQHAKVAEEAVSGWENAENEVLVLKKHVDALTQNNSVLEERVSQLDGALKECLRQLRQAREDQEEKLYDAVINKTSEWESKKSQLENELVELRSQLENANKDAIDTMIAGIRCKLDIAEKENSNLKLNLLSMTEELQRRTTEGDLSTQAAEAASKQHLDSMTKVAKLEAECRLLKSVANKGTLANDHGSVSASSIYADSVTDSQSDCGERIHVAKKDGYKFRGLGSVESEPYLSGACKLATELGHYKNERSHGRSFVVPSVEIDLMDDFLDMERLAALPDPHSESHHGARVGDEGNPLRELEAMINRTVELEENLKKMEKEKMNLEISLKGCQSQLKISEDQLNKTHGELVDLSAELALANEAKVAMQKEAESTKLKLKSSKKLLDESEVNLMQIRIQLKKVNEAKRIVEVELENANVMKIKAESKVKAMEVEVQSLRSSIRTLEKEVKKERNFSRETMVKCDLLESEISRMKLDSQCQGSTIIDEFRINQDKELEVAATKFAECQKTIASLGQQLKSLATLEDFLVD